MIENLENEIWVTHPEYDWMAASNYGRIKSLERDIYKKDGTFYQHRQERLIKPQPSNNGYLHFDISKNGKRIPYKVHRFVLECFKQELILDGIEVNHKSEVKTENSPDNLELCTRQYNIEYSQAKAVGQYDLEGNLIKIWKSTMEAEREGGFIHTGISQCCNNKRKTHRGFIWKYVDTTETLQDE